jgi:hypothetical protein
LAPQGSPVAPAAAVSPHWQQQLLKCEVSISIFSTYAMPTIIITVDGARFTLSTSPSSCKRHGFTDSH